MNAVNTTEGIGDEKRQVATCAIRESLGLIVMGVALFVPAGTAVVIISNPDLLPGIW